MMAKGVKKLRFCGPVDLVFFLMEAFLHLMITRYFHISSSIFKSRRFPII